MKRAIIISVILHILIVVVVFFLKPDQREKRQQPLIAEIIVPEQKQPEPAPPKHKQKTEKQQRKIRIPITDTNQQPSDKMLDIAKGSAKRDEKGKAKDTSAKLSPKPSPQQRQPIKIPDGFSADPGSEQPTTREKLFDPTQIAKIARESASDKGQLSSALQTNAKISSGWLQLFVSKMHIMFNRYLNAERAGTVKILIIITRDGNLKNVSVVESSGYPSLDESAMKSAKAAAPFWPLPKSFSEDRIEITYKITIVN